LKIGISLKEKYGSGLWAFGQVADRFNPRGYKVPLTTEQQLELATKVKTLRGVELHYPTDFKRDEVEKVKAILTRCNLEVPTVCLNFFTESKWQKGSLTSKDPNLRKETIETAKDAIDIAGEIGSNACTLWLGQDGHDYLFYDHSRAWDWMLDGISEITRYNEKVKVFLEYKQKEPRTHLQISNVGKALFIVNKLGLKNLGVVIDVGHALMSDENLAESVEIVSRNETPFTMHFNDNYGYWDDDMIPGSVNFWRFVELFYQLKKIGYEGWYDLDIFPYREDPVRAVEQGIGFIGYMRRRVDEYYGEIKSLVEEGDVHKTIDGLRKIFLKGCE